MLFSRYFVLALLICSSLGAAQLDPVTKDLPPRIKPNIELNDPSRCIDALIQSTERQLLSQKEVAEHLKNYSELRDRLLVAPDNGALASAVVSQAEQLYGEIEEGQLCDLFSEDFLQDLHFFAAIAQRSQTKAH